MVVDGELADSVLEFSTYVDTLNGVDSESADSFEKYTSSLIEKEDDSESANKLFKAIAEKSVDLKKSQEKDFEPAYNLALHILTLAPNFDEVFGVFLDNLISNPPEVTHGSWLVLSILTNSFNILSKKSTWKFKIFNYIIEFAEKTGNSHLLASQISQVSTWAEEWEGLTLDQKKQLFLTAAKILESTDKKASSEFILKAVALSDKPDENTNTLVRNALESELVYDFDPILALSAVQALGKNSPLLILLKTVYEGDLAGLKANNGANLASEAGVDFESIEQKTRVAALAAVASKASSRTLGYNEIASAIDVEEDEVETWVINAIRAGLVEGRLSQLDQKFDIHRASPIGSFGIEEWKQIQNKLDVWKSSLRDILQVVQGARDNIKRVA